MSDPISIRNDYGYDLIGRLRDRILLFRDKFDAFEVQAFDNQLRMSWSKTLDDLRKRDMQVLAVAAGKNDFSVIFRNIVRGETSLRVHKYDPGANLIDSAVMKNYTNSVFTQPVLNYVRSDDRNCFVVFNRADVATVQATCFQLDKMTVLWDETFGAGEELEALNIKGIVVGNQGEFLIVSETHNRKSKATEHAFLISELGRGAKNRQAALDLPESFTRDVRFAFDNSAGCLVGAGLYGEKNKDRVHGAFFLRHSFTTDTLSFVRYEPFDEQFFSIMRKRDGDDGGKGISDAHIQHLVLRQDGGAVMIAERHHEIQRGGSTTRGTWRDGARTIVDFYFDDLFIITFYPDGQVHWKTVLHKKQYSQDDEGIYSSYYLFQQTDRLHFLFNDEIRYENTCSEYVVDPLGGFDRNNVLNTVGQSMRLRFRDSIQLNARECLIPSEFRNKLRLLLLRYGG
ncbi:MAG: hypothetical protein SFV52_11510 [Saprospiraceae bacterium]|nr:hypothetical protein [Saprospiraceae bacterium]